MPESDTNLNDTINFILSFVVRRRWWISGIATTVAMATILVVLTLPNQYTSQATLQVVQQQVSQRFVEPGTNTSAADAIQSLSRELLSHAQLLKIIQDFDLYSDIRQRATLDEIAEGMRNNITVEPLDQIGRSDNYGAFRITFTANSPRLAQTVTGRLTSLFIETNSKTRGDSALRTTSFLSEQLEAARKKLAEQEQRLQDFKMRNAGELPEQQPATLGALTSLQIQLQSTNAGLSRAQQQRKTLESSVETTIRGYVAGLQSEKAALLTKYTPRHSDVIKKDQEIARWQDLLDHWKAETRLTSTLDSPALASLRSQLDANAAEIEQLSKEQQAMSAQIEQSQQRLNIAPVREQQMAGMLRDYEEYKSQYEDLQNKQLKSQLTTNLEEKQEGQQFRLVDPPTLPLTPSKPPRVKICLGGLAGGLLLGLALAFLVETKNRSFHFEKELSAAFKVPLVLGIPLLLTPSEERIRSGKRAFEWLVISIISVSVLAAEYYIYRNS
jgi:polysaccharide chain length determinant protein (PEP-CTERM system associated)